jgi:LuxR family maltose regulon positive regulatory protein
MIDQLLATKLQPPILRKEVVSRPRLAERLNAGLWQPAGFVRKLTLVSAPAGFGKTTLVAQWLAALSSSPLPWGEGPGVRATWLSLDESDNDPIRFLLYLIAVLRRLQPDFGGVTAGILQLPQPPPASVILTSLVNELAGLPTPSILALDDYHAIHTPAIHQQLAFILDNQPANLHLVILTREDPLLPVSRLRARGQLLEIRQEDLRFTKSETSDFLQRNVSMALEKGDIDALESHTEGWAAGLQLAALSLYGRVDVKDIIHDLTTSDRYILDYLFDEVFTHQTSNVQDFLVQTSVLKRLSGPLCDAVINDSGSAEMLRSLEQANLFIVPLDPARAWVRYHHLFAELLRHRLRLSSFSEASLNQRASRWFEAQGVFQEAIEHASAARDWGSAAHLIGAASERLLKRGEVVTLLNWFALIPAEVTRSSPELCLSYAWAAMLTSHFELALPLLEHLEKLAEPGSQLLGQVAAAQAYLARSQHDTHRTIEKSRQALALLPGEDIVGRGNLAMNLGLVYWHEGCIAEAEPALAQACELSEKSGNAFALLTARIFLARIDAVRGKIHQAAEKFEILLQAAKNIPILCLAHYDLATIHLEWNDLPKATLHLEHGLALSRHSGNLEFQQSGCLLQAILAHAQGDRAGAVAALNEAHAQAIDFPPAVRSRTAAFGVQLALAYNDPHLLSEWSVQVDANVDAHSFYRFIGLTRPRLLLAQGDHTQAAQALLTLFETASKAGWGYGCLAIRILQSLAADSSDEAVQFLAGALSMGEPEGFLRSFVDAGRLLIPILHEAARRGISPSFVGQILAALGAGQNKPALQAILIEPLSARELEVLRLICAGLSNREIASRLYISPGTAKTHIHNLCGKLGTRNRTEAAMQAKKLGLV